MRHILVNTLAASDLLNHRQRLAIYQRFGMTVGEKAFVASRCFFQNPNLSTVALGDRSFINHFCFLDNSDAIEIGDNVCIGPGVRILTTTHEIGEPSRRSGNGCVRKPVKIGYGCWIGAGAIILPGVTIGDGCVIGAGALVNRDCLPNYRYVGVPAKVPSLPLMGV